MRTLLLTCTAAILTGCAPAEDHVKVRYDSALMTTPPAPPAALPSPPSRCDTTTDRAGKLTTICY